MEIIHFSVTEIARVFWLAVLSFLIAIAWTPIFTNFLYKHKLGKRIRDAKNAPIF